MSRLFMLLGVIMLSVTTACGGTDGAAVGSTDDGMQLSISSPGDGATVRVPFTVELSSSVPLDEPETGRHHVHVFFDGDDSEYTLVYGNSVEITELPPGVGPGDHVMNASLRHADHSAAGVETRIDLTIDPGAGTQGGDTDDAPGYDY
ncbi:MAG: hypothetical protein ACRDOY_10695 [Nocardioidaceae bacterium]